MMKARTIRHLIIALLLSTGVFHLAVALLAPEGRALGLTVFGLVYIGLSFYVRSDTNDGSKNHSRNAIIASIVACTIGLGVGGYDYLMKGGALALPIMFAIDAVIIAAGAVWLAKTRGKK